MMTEPFTLASRRSFARFRAAAINTSISARSKSATEFSTTCRTVFPLRCISFVESDFDSLNDSQIGTSLVLGKYLSPRLYLSYGISLTESINTVKMRYTLNDRWTIRTEAGKERSADLVYTIEK